MKLIKKIGFLGAFIIPILVVLGYYGGGFWTFSAFIFAYTLIPIFDECIGKDKINVAKDDFEDILENKYFETLVHALVYVQVGIIIWALCMLAWKPLSYLEYIGFLLSMMSFTGNGINVAHELGHKKSSFARFNAKLNLMTTCYMHFYVEHNRGHHVHVATPLDPATSKKNQSFYAFWVQTVFGSFRSAWKIEKERLAKKNQSFYSIYHNEMLRAIIFPLLFISVLTFVLSFQVGYFAYVVPLFFFSQSIMAFSSLEAVNYIEHYGMVRKEIAPNKYERVNPLHSWNSCHLISNLMLFQLQRHSDHHAYASRPYQVLRHFDESPQLPFGYPVMIIIALMPPVWFALMNKKLEAWQSLGIQETEIRKVIESTI
ncbi:MAG: alkane 1-monooxygenase [Bacteroidetes bacterium]|nr:MAG: alkane 1-monooxygenase [Bacteroidota bacterium]TAG89859.1 MAG: alkane 1-monooxygenase [Bacteroidota bacterium]